MAVHGLLHHGLILTCTEEEIVFSKRERKRAHRERDDTFFYFLSEEKGIVENVVMERRLVLG